MTLAPFGVVWSFWQPSYSSSSSGVCVCVCVSVCVCVCVCAGPEAASAERCGRRAIFKGGLGVLPQKVFGI